MNPVLAEIYSTILPSAPFVIVAYVGILVALFIYVFFIISKLHRTEKKLAALEERVEELTASREAKGE